MITQKMKDDFAREDRLSLISVAQWIRRLYPDDDAAEPYGPGGKPIK